MKAAVLTALKGSIKKWQGIVAGTGNDNGTANCPLCVMFYNQSESCQGCPVQERVEMAGCGGTPWVDWSLSHVGPMPYANTTDEHTKLAKKELRFLQSLLPKKKKTVKKAKNRL